MGMGDDEDGCDRDDRTLFVAGLSEKMTEKLLYELFHQAGPIERVSIPVEKDGKIKTFGFVTYKHLSSVDYALNVFAGTKLFGRELTLRNRNASKNREREQSQFNQQASASLTHGYASPFSHELSPALQGQNFLQQQLIMLATGQSMQTLQNAGNQMFGASSLPFNSYDSTRNDLSGSHRDFVDRNRHHRGENRSNRSNPYRSRSRSPQKHFRSRDRSRSPISSRSRQYDSGRSREGGNYHRWGKR